MSPMSWTALAKLFPLLAFLMGLFPVSVVVAQTPAEGIHLEVPPDGTSMPMAVIGDQPAVEVTINGEGPYVFLVDTGAAGGGRIDPELAAKLDLETLGQVQVGDPSGRNRATRDLVRVDHVRFGDAEARGVPMLLAGELQAGRSIDGILGFALFRDVLLTLDYPAKTLRLTPGGLGPPDGQDIVADVGDGGIPSVEVDLGGVTVTADIDSGSMGWVTLPAAVAGKLDLAAEPVVVGRAETPFNSFEILQAPLDGAVQVGRHVFPNPPVEFADMFPRGNLGGQLLGHFAVTFDQRNRRVRFEREGDGPLGKPRRYRVGVMFAGGPADLVVRGTVPGSPGEKAGLREGDRVLAVNGLPVEEVDLGTIFSKPETVTLKIERGSETIEVALTPEAG